MANTITVAEYLTHAIDLSQKTQKQIADEVGWPKPNMISMLKKGVTKVPIDKVPDLARACNIDPANFLRIAMIEYMPEVWKVIQETQGEILSKEEKRIIKDFRKKRDTVQGMLEAEL